MHTQKWVKPAVDMKWPGPAIAPKKVPGKKFQARGCGILMSTNKNGRECSI
jgi:hypothetical protein